MAHDTALQVIKVLFSMHHTWIETYSNMSDNHVYTMQVNVKLLQYGIAKIAINDINSIITVIYNNQTQLININNNEQLQQFVTFISQ